MELEKQIETWMKKYTAREILGPWTYAPGGIPMNDVEETVLVYDNDLYIEIMDDHYYLIIETCEWVSEDLCFLEEILAEYRLECGYMPYIEYEDQCKKEEMKEGFFQGMVTILGDIADELTLEELVSVQESTFNEEIREMVLDLIKEYAIGPVE